MKSTAYVLLARTVLCSLLLVAYTGCEDEDVDVPADNAYESVDRGDLSGPAAEFPEISDLTITPGTVTLNTDGDMAAFTVSGGVQPYTWSVQDVFRGSVVDSGGAGAVYQRSAAGDNSVFVEDSRGEKIYAVVEQP